MAAKKPAARGKGRAKFTEQEVEVQKIRALKLWLRGSSYPQIQESLGIGLATAYKRVQDALDDMRPHADFDAYRARQLAELHLVRTLLINDLAQYEGMGIPRFDFLAGIDRLCKLQERESKLLGLDRVPQPFEQLRELSDEEIAAEMKTWTDEVLGG